MADGDGWSSAIADGDSRRLTRSASAELARKASGDGGRKAEWAETVARWTEADGARRSGSGNSWALRA
jgi:hypothetical protein